MVSGMVQMLTTNRVPADLSAFSAKR
jgi:hypothetical protein